MITFLLAVLLFVACVALYQCRRNRTPAGHNGYIVVRADTTVVTEAYYADTLDEAVLRRSERGDDAPNWRIYQRVEPAGP